MSVGEICYLINVIKSIYTHCTQVDSVEEFHPPSLDQLDPGLIRRAVVALTGVESGKGLHR